MDELEKLRREKDKLAKQREIRETKTLIRQMKSKEKSQLKKEIRREKYARTYKVASTIGRVGSAAAKDVTKYAYKKMRQPAKPRKVMRIKQKTVKQKSPRTIQEAIYGGY